MTSIELKSKIPKFVALFFLISQLCTGTNFGFAVLLKKRYRIIGRCITLMISAVFIIGLCMASLSVMNGGWMWYKFFEYTVFICILHKQSYNFFDFLIDFSKMYNVTENEKFSMSVIIIFSICMFLVKMFSSVYRCLNMPNPYCITIGITNYFFYSSGLIPLDLTTVAQILIMYYIYCYVKNLRACMNISPISISFVVYRYKLIADLYDKVRPLYSKLIIFCLIFGVPNLLGSLWWMLHSIKAQEIWYAYTHQLVFTFHFVLKICLPAITVEMIAVQIEDVKILLHEELMTCTGDKTHAEVLGLLRYMKARPLQHLVCRVVPIDARLLLSLCSLCTSYFIVILQFTHLYD